MATIIDPSPPKISLDFQPSAARARQLDRRMRQELAASLRYLLGELGPHLAGAARTGEDILDRLAEGPVSPLVYAVYSDLIFAIDADDLEEADRLLTQLSRQVEEKREGLTIRDLADPDLDEDSDRYVRYIDSDPDQPLDLTAPPSDASDKSRQSIAGAFRLLEKCDPDLAAEMGVLLREIILCRGRQTAPDYTFDGASCFLLWGAILINAERSGGELEMVQMLAHESAHNLLFGLCPSQPLLLNDPAERHASPLRHDPRPLEGIYHATFVTARMHCAALRLRESGLLSTAQEKIVTDDLVYTRQSFEQGLAVLEAHARLTDPGQAILDGARAYMKSVAN
jgi:HEXXH motif-containing protein